MPKLYLSRIAVQVSNVVLRCGEQRHKIIRKRVAFFAPWTILARGECGSFLLFPDKADVRIKYVRPPTLCRIVHSLVCHTVPRRFSFLFSFLLSPRLHCVFSKPALAHFALHRGASLCFCRRRKRILQDACFSCRHISAHDRHVEHALLSPCPHGTEKYSN